MAASNKTKRKNATHLSELSHAYARHDKLLAKRMRKIKLRYFKCWQAPRSPASTSFDGEGDSGQINNITAYAGDAEKSDVR